jgi:5-oxoprolinase (ATP-hydrolysing)
VVRTDGTIQELAAIDGAEVSAGDRLVMETPGGGGWGDPTSNRTITPRDTGD